MQFALWMTNVPRAGRERAQRFCFLVEWFGSSEFETFGAISAPFPSARELLVSHCGFLVCTKWSCSHSHTSGSCFAPLLCQELVSIYWE